jgi:RING-type zinc-finger
MGALSFLVGLHLTILSAHAAVRFASEVYTGDPIETEHSTARRSRTEGRRRGGRGTAGDVTVDIDHSDLPLDPASSGGSRGLPAVRTGGQLAGDGGSEGPKGTGTGRTRQCPLCMEGLAHPSAPPCGHLFCWDCIHTWANSNTSSSGSNADIKCPVCRCLFKRKAVRALHGFY